MALPAAFGDLAHFVATASASASSSIEAPEQPRPKRAAGIAASAHLGFEVPSGPVRVLPPTPPRVCRPLKRAKDATMELEGAAAVAAVESATMSLVSDLRDVEGALAAEQLRRGELLAYNGHLQGERRSRASFQSAQTGRNAIVLAEFDPLNQTPFNFVSEAGRKRLSRNMQVLKGCLAGLCVAPRGSAERLAATAGTPLTASVAKCKTLVSMFLEQMLPALGPLLPPSKVARFRENLAVHR